MYRIPFRVNTEIKEAFNLICSLNGWNKGKKLSLIAEKWAECEDEMIDKRITASLLGGYMCQLNIFVSDKFRNQCIKHKLRFAEKMRNLLYVFLLENDFLPDGFSPDSTISKITIKSDKYIIDSFCKKSKENGHKADELIIGFMEEYVNKS